MPSSINGIGTTYYGKGNKETYQGVCEYCGVPGQLSNYETRLWFTIIFVPIIPLGKKQILNYCPHCTRHTAIPFAEWERIKEDAINQSGDQLAENQDDPEAAVNMHSTLTAFNKHEDAERLATIMKSKFNDDVNVQLYLAGWHETRNENAAANECIERANQIDPDDPAVKRAAGIGMIENGQCDLAREKLSFMEPPSEEYQPAVYFMLAKEYQKQGNHQSALEILQMVHEHTPSAGEEKEFRAAVNRSEKALGVTASTLPKKSVLKSPAVLWTAGIAVLVAAVMYWNHHISTHRTLHVVNGMGAPITVEVAAADGDSQSVTVPPLTRSELTVAEGKHTVKLVSPADVTEPYEIDIAASWFERFFDSPVYLIDPSRTGVVTWAEIQYTAQPNPGLEPAVRFHVCEPFTEFEDIDYRFVQPDENIRTKRKTVTKTHVEFIGGPPGMVVAVLGDRLQTGQVLNYLERHLSLSDSDRGQMADFYREFCRINGQLPRGREFLLKDLLKEPVDVEWHATLQNILVQTDSHDEIIAHYEKLVQAVPDNANALYLRGQLEPTVSKQKAYFDRVLAIDEDHPKTIESLAELDRLQGNYEEALAHVAKATAATDDKDSLLPMKWTLMLESRKWDELEQELDKESAKNPRQPSFLALKFQRLLYSSQGDKEKLAKSQQAIDELFQGMGSTFKLGQRNKIAALYFERDFEQMAKVAEQMGVDAAVNRVTAYIASEKLDAAAEEMAKVPAQQHGYYQLALSIAFGLADDQSAADKWRVEAVKSFEELGGSAAYIAELLSESRPVNDESLGDLSTSPELKALVLSWAARKGEMPNKEWQALAEKLTTAVAFPHYLVRRMSADAK